MVFAEPRYLEKWRGPLDPGPQATPAQPVVQVSWFAAQAYCEAQGARLLERRLSGPSRDLAVIEARLEAVRFLVEQARLRGESLPTPKARQGGASRPMIASDVARPRPVPPYFRVVLASA